MKEIIPISFFFLFIILNSSTAPFGSVRSAYKHHYRGNIYYQKDDLNKAEFHFRKAYQSIPNNYGFALSYGVCLARNGKASKGLQVFQSGSSFIAREDPEYRQKRILKHFFEGLILCYDQNYDAAIHRIRKSISLQEHTPNAAYLSIFYNTLGYATLLNQGKADFGRSGLPPHYHVHKRDMERAFEYFGEALNYNADNPSALYNYKILSDTLESTSQYDLSSDTTANVLKYETELNVSNDVFELLDFSSYQEVLFLLDISGSMVMEKVICKGRDRFSVMKETALHILRKMPETTQLGIATIGGDCGTAPKLWIKTGKIDRKELQQNITFLAPDGTTPLLTILQETPVLFSAKSKQRKAIFFISDGANICSGGEVDICEWSERLNRQGITINIFTFLDATLNHVNAFAEYSCLADNTHGKIVYMDNLRCKIEPYSFEFIESAQLHIPTLHKVSCFGPSVKDLWAIYKE